MLYSKYEHKSSDVEKSRQFKIKDLESAGGMVVSYHALGLSFILWKLQTRTEHEEVKKMNEPSKSKAPYKIPFSVIIDSDSSKNFQLKKTTCFEMDTDGTYDPEAVELLCSEVSQGIRDTIEKFSIWAKAVSNWK
jgi:hypothetical protein